MSGVDPVPGELNPEQPLTFVHIPRTGGMTLNSLFQGAFGHERTLLGAHLYRTHGADLNKFAFVEGHVGTGFFREKFGAGWYSNAITMLREPVARTVSQARHMRAIPGAFQEYLRGRVRDPAEVFERLPRLINLQTRQLSGTAFDDSYVDATALAKAKSTLEQLAFGLTESFDSSVALFMERLQIGVPRFEVSNVSSGMQDDDLLSDDFRAAAREHNDLDEELYAFALSLWQGRVASYAESLLVLPTEPATLTSGLRFRRQRFEEGIRLSHSVVSVGRCAGWVFVDGRPADAALLRVGDQVTPLIPRVERSDAGLLTGNLHDRNAGVVGALRIPPDAQSVELVAFDRSRNRRAVRAFEISRVAPDPLSRRLPAAFRNQLKRLRRP